MSQSSFYPGVLSDWEVLDIDEKDVALSQSSFYPGVLSDRYTDWQIERAKDVSIQFLSWGSF